MTVGRRMKSTGSFRQDWLQDSGTYPIIVVLSGAIGMSSCFMAWKITNCKDVRMTKATKGHVVRTW